MSKLSTVDSDYSVPLFIYFLGLTLPLVLIILPRFLSAVRVDFIDANLVLKYLFRKEREFPLDSIRVKTRKRGIAILEAALPGGTKRDIILFAAGFSKDEWNAILTKIDGTSTSSSEVATM